jgi:hypothetical protein
MAQSLRDQMLKMGLVDKKQATQAKKATYKKNKEEDKGRSQKPDENKLHARQALEEKKKQARQANEKQQQELKKNEAIAQIRQLISSNLLPLKDGAIAYRFTDNNKIVKILLPTKEMVDELSQGTLAIVREKGGYGVVPSSIAEKIQGLRLDLIVVHNVSPQKPEQDPDDPYSAYTIPDDLIW